MGLGVRKHRPADTWFGINQPGRHHYFCRLNTKYQGIKATVQIMWLPVHHANNACINEINAGLENAFKLKLHPDTLAFLSRIH